MVFRGWSADIHPETLDLTLGQMTLAFNAARNPRGTSLSTAEPFDAASNCINLDGGREYLFNLAGDGAFTLAGAQGESLTATRAGDISYTFDLTMRNNVQGLTFASRPGVSGNTLAITGAWPPAEARELCGVVASS